MNKAHAKTRICYTAVTINAEYGYCKLISDVKKVIICMLWVKIPAVCRKKEVKQHNSNGFRKENDSMANVPTPHIKAKMGEIAEKILMP